MLCVPLTDRATRTRCTQFSNKWKKSEILIYHHWYDGRGKKIHSYFYPWTISTSIYPVRYSNQYRRLRVPVKSLLSATLLLSSYLAMHTRDVWFGQLFHNTLRMCSSKAQAFMELYNLIQHTFIFISMGRGLTVFVDPDPDPNGSLHFHADHEPDVQIGLLIRIGIEKPDNSGTTIQSRDPNPNLSENAWSGSAQNECGPANYVHTCYVSISKSEFCPEV